MIPGTVCYSCYAFGGQYKVRNVKVAQQRRLEALAHPRWVDAIIFLLQRYHAEPLVKVPLGKRGVTRWRWNETGFHRWHDSGDLQSAEHLGQLCAVARATPRIKYWLPTQELGMVQYYAKAHAVPDNLLIRVSSVNMGEHVPRSWPWTSSVGDELSFAKLPSGAYHCPAPQQGHRCGSCRACWDPRVSHVVYSAH